MRTSQTAQTITRMISTGIISIANITTLNILIGMVI